MDISAPIGWTERILSQCRQTLGARTPQRKTVGSPWSAKGLRTGRFSHPQSPFCKTSHVHAKLGRFSLSNVAK